MKRYNGDLLGEKSFEQCLQDIEANRFDFECSFDKIEDGMNGTATLSFSNEVVEHYEAYVEDGKVKFTALHVIKNGEKYSWENFIGSMAKDDLEKIEAYFR